MTTTARFQAKGMFRKTGGGRTVVAVPESGDQPRGRIPRVTRLLALAHRFEKLIRDGDVKDYAELARLGHVSRARVTQIMNLLNLAPDIQEKILFLPAVISGDDPIRERQIRPLIAIGALDWCKQRRTWRAINVAIFKTMERPVAMPDRAPSTPRSM